MTKYCRGENCAEVRYTPYKKTSGIRYRYPGEDWILVDGDNYTIADIDQMFRCYNITYKLTVKYTVRLWSGSRKDRPSDVVTYNLERVTGHLIQHPDKLLQEFPAIHNPVLSNSVFGENYSVAKVHYLSVSGNYEFLYELDTDSTSPEAEAVKKENVRYHWVHIIPDSISIEFTEIDDSSKICSRANVCTFIVTKNDEEVLKIARGDCPEVEVIDEDCQLSDSTSTVKIDKIPWLSTVEVTAIDLDADKISGVPFPSPGIGRAPLECLNIYRHEIFDPLPSGSPGDPNEPVFGDFIEQICSDPDCPPPEYEVVCGCVERCPDDTCTATCGSSFCCYDPNTGRSVKEIPFSDFFPDGRVGGTR